MTASIETKYELSGKVVSIGSNMPKDMTVENFRVMKGGLDVTDVLSIEEISELHDAFIAERAAVREAGMSA